MKNQYRDQSNIRRRGLLAVIGTSLLSSAIVVIAFFSSEKEERESVSNNGLDSRFCRGLSGLLESEKNEYTDSENILKHGGIKNDDSVSAIVSNVHAINEASAAADNNTVYLPEGDWYIGSPHTTNGKALRPGNTSYTEMGAVGLGFVGDGPEKTFLKLGHGETGGSHTIEYAGPDTHENVTWSDLTLDGNIGNLGLDMTQASHWGIRASTGGDFTFTNVRIQNWGGNGIFIPDDRTTATFDRCVFKNCGIAVAKAANGGSVSHGIALNADNCDITVTNCEFRLISGNAIDLDGAGGTGLVENCWAKSISTGFMKVNDWDTLELSKIHYEGATTEIRNELPSGVPDTVFWKHITGNDPANVPNVTINDIEAEKMEFAALSGTNGYDSTFTGGTQGPIVFRDITAGSTTRGAIRADGASFDLNLGDVGVSNVDGPVFEASSSTGSVDTLHWNNATELGEMGDISVGTTNEGGSLFNPTVPSQSDVGIQTTSEPSGDNSPSVSWVTPSSGDTASGSVTLQMSASDSEDTNDSLTVEYRVDGSSWSTTAYNADSGYYESPWDASTVPSGTITLEAMATDSAGNTSSAAVDIAIEAGIFGEWTPRWGSTTSDWSVVSGTEFEGGSALEFNADNNGRHAISWDGVGEPSDVEVLDKFRVQQSGIVARSQLRSSTTNGNENGYWLEFESVENAFRLGKYTNGDWTTLSRFGTIETETFYYRRFRAEGNILKAKVWKTSENEPSDWDIEVTDGDHSSGWVGFGSFSPGLVETDVTSVATGGDTAPFMGRDNAPSISWVAPTDGSTITGTVTVQIEANDSEDANDSLTVEYRVNGSSWSTAAYNADSGYYEGTWDTTQVADGDHTLEATATDSAGNTSSETLTVTSVNASAPIVDSLSLSEIETNDSDAEFDANWQVSDGDGDLSSVGLSLIQESDGSVEDSTSISVTGGTASGTTRLMAADDDGSGNGYSVELSVTDNKNNTSSDTASATESEDTTSNAPVMSRFSVSEAQRPDPHAEITVVWDVSDPDGDLDSVEIDVADSNGTVKGVTWSLGGATASDMDSFRILEGGGTTFDITLSVTDATGQTSSASKSVST